jgi:ribonuclease G
MTGWIVERGIGETRAALVEGDEIVEARILLEGVVEAGSRIAARLVSTGRNAVARADDGAEYLLPRGAPGLSEGAATIIEVTRSAIPGAEPWKRPLARIAGDNALSDQLSGKPGTLPASWDDLIEEARDGTVRFAGGELRIFATPAMTLIDVDGHLDAGALGITGAGEAARAIRRLDIGGSIGIDLPTARDKSARNAAAAAIDANLIAPFERTAVNGYGFVQIVRPRRRASLIELVQDRAGFEARALLRRLAAEAPGARCIVGHPAVIAMLEAHPEWQEALARQIGGAVTLRVDAALAISGGYGERG